MVSSHLLAIKNSFFKVGKKKSKQASSFLDIREAINSGDLESIKKLVKHGAPLFDDRSTALHVTAGQKPCNLAIMEYFLRLNEIDPSWKNFYGHTVLDVVSMSSYGDDLKGELADMIEESQSIWNRFFASDKSNRFKVAKPKQNLLTQNFAETPEIGHNSNSAQEWLEQKAKMRKEYDEIIEKRHKIRQEELSFVGRSFRQDYTENDLKEYLDGGGNINASTGFNVTNETALHMACRVGNFKMVKLLIENGAEIDYHNTKGQTAFDVAKEHLENSKIDSQWQDKKEDYEEIVNYLKSSPKSSPKYPEAKSLGKQKKSPVK